MSLNIVNKTTAIFSGLKKAGLGIAFPLTGFVSGMNTDCFKYSPTGSVNDILVIKRIDLGLLFEGIDVDLSELDFSQPSELTFPDPELLLGSPVESEPLLINTLHEETEDLFKQTFNNWKSTFGIKDLDYNEVSLGIDHNHLKITVVKSDIYTGSLSVKFRNLPPPEVIVMQEPENINPVPIPTN